MPVPHHAPNQTGAVLAAMSAALAAGDGDEFTQALAELVRIEPRRWGTLVLSSNVFPQPGARGFAAILKSFIRFLPGAIDLLSDQQLDELLGILYSTITIQAVTDAIREELEMLTTWEQPNQETVYRLGAFLEDQVHIVEKIIHHKSSDRGYFDPTAVMADSLTDPNSPNLYSPQAILDGLSECLQLIHAYVLLERGGISGPIISPSSPYEDSEIRKLLELAALTHAQSLLIDLHKTSRLARRHRRRWAPLIPST